MFSTNPVVYVVPHSADILRKNFRKHVLPFKSLLFIVNISLFCKKVFLGRYFLKFTLTSSILRYFAFQVFLPDFIFTFKRSYSYLRTAILYSYFYSFSFCILTFVFFSFFVINFITFIRFLSVLTYILLTNIIILTLSHCTDA